MRIELNIFSGRPNPSWELSEQEASELARRLTGLSPINQAPEHGGLGYRGFIISNPTTGAALPTRMSVLNGVITSSESGRTTHYKDTNDVERWLIEQARKQGHGDILDQTVGKGR